MGSGKDQSCLTYGAWRSKHLFLTSTRRDDSEMPSCRQSPTQCKWKQFLPWSDSPQEFGIFLTLQFFHQYFLFSLAALVSNCEAPACNASARLSSSDSFWSLSSTLSTFILMISTTCEGTDTPETLFTPWNVTPHPKPSLLPPWCVMASPGHCLKIPACGNTHSELRWAQMPLKVENKDTSWNSTVSSIKVFDFFVIDPKTWWISQYHSLTSLRTSHYFPRTFSIFLTWTREIS